MSQGFGAGQKFYEGLCLKAVNQCIGRAVRHRNDYATMLLLDERYNRMATKAALPDWIKRSLKVCDFEQCFEFVDKVSKMLLNVRFCVKLNFISVFQGEKSNIKRM